MVEPGFNRMVNDDSARVSADWLRALERTARAVRAPDCTFGQILDDAASEHGDRPALIDETTTFTYRKLASRMNRYARWALSAGVAKGDCVALLMPNCPEYVAIWSGISRVGGVVALVNTNLQLKALAHCLDIVRPRHVIVAAELIDTYRCASPMLREQPTLWVHGPHTGPGLSLCEAVSAMDGSPVDPAGRPPVNLSDRALYIYNSGTTGLPKAANVSHRRIVEWSHWFCGVMDTQPDDRMYNCLPMYHSVGGIVAIGSLLVSGGSVVIREKFSASRFWDDVTDTNCTLFQYIGELCRYLVNAPPSKAETSHRLRICCGNGLRSDVWQRFKERFGIPRILEYYAATEGSFSLYNVEGKPGAIGRLPGFLRHRSPVALVKFDIATEKPVRDKDGFCTPCGIGEAGEALGRLPHGIASEPNRFEGYIGEDESERKILRNVFTPGDRWFRTGDIMKRDDKGYFYFVDRIGDTYRWKGENVSTTEVASVVALCPGISQVTVYGVAVPGSDGRAGMAAIVVDKTFTPAALHTLLAGHLPAYARPQYIKIVSNLAVTETFKEKKRQLIEQGIDPSVGDGLVFFDDPATGEYRPFTAEDHAHLLKRSSLSRSDAYV
jgi:fatty-acyl-CoA synthase